MLPHAGRLLGLRRGPALRLGRLKPQSLLPGAWNIPTPGAWLRSLGRTAGGVAREKLAHVAGSLLGLDAVPSGRGGRREVAEGSRVPAITGDPSGRT